jgi:transcription initiation factor TFIIH subunit 3
MYSYNTYLYYVTVLYYYHSAQKMAIAVDSLVLTRSQESSFLQQASYLTGGVYQKPKYQQDTLQILLMHYLPGLSARSSLKAPLLVRYCLYKCYMYIYLK